MPFLTSVLTISFTFNIGFDYLFYYEWRRKGMGSIPYFLLKWNGYAVGRLAARPFAISAEIGQGSDDRLEFPEGTGLCDKRFST